MVHYLLFMAHILLHTISNTIPKQARPLSFQTLCLWGAMVWPSISSVAYML